MIDTHIPYYIPYCPPKKSLRLNVEASHLPHHLLPLTL